MYNLIWLTIVAMDDAWMYGQVENSLAWHRDTSYQKRNWFDKCGKRCNVFQLQSSSRSSSRCSCNCSTCVTSCPVVGGCVVDDCGCCIQVCTFAWRQSSWSICLDWRNSPTPSVSFCSSKASVLLPDHHLLVRLIIYLRFWLASLYLGHLCIEFAVDSNIRLDTVFQISKPLDVW